MYNKECIRVSKLSTYRRPLFITNHQVHKWNDQVKPHNHTQKSKPNKVSKAMPNIT